MIKQNTVKIKKIKNYKIEQNEKSTKYSLNENIFFASHSQVQTIVSRTGHKLMKDCIAVSYTHLDVYKRQV